MGEGSEQEGGREELSELSFDQAHRGVSDGREGR